MLFQSVDDLRNCGRLDTTESRQPEWQGNGEPGKSALLTQRKDPEHTETECVWPSPVLLLRVVQSGTNPGTVGFLYEESNPAIGVSTARTP